MCRGLWHLSRQSCDICRSLWHLSRQSCDICRGLWHLSRLSCDICRGLWHLSRQCCDICRGLWHLSAQQAASVAVADPLYSKNAWKFNIFTKNRGGRTPVRPMLDPPLDWPSSSARPVTPDVAWNMLKWTHYIYNEKWWNMVQNRIKLPPSWIYAGNNTASALCDQQVLLCQKEHLYLKMQVTSAYQVHYKYVA